MDQDLSNKSKQPGQEALEKPKNIMINILTSNVMIANSMIKNFIINFMPKTSRDEQNKP